MRNDDSVCWRRQVSWPARPGVCSGNCLCVARAESSAAARLTAALQLVTLGHTSLATTSIYVSLSKQAQKKALQEHAL